MSIAVLWRTPPLPHLSPHVLAEGTWECVQGGPWAQEDIGNFFEPWFEIWKDERKPDRIYSMSVNHWMIEDKARAALFVYTGPAQGHLNILHHDVDPDTRICGNCGMDCGSGDPLDDLR